MAFLGGTWGTVVGVVALICAIWVIYDVWTNNKKLKDTTKIIWTVCAILFSIITAIVYYFVGKK
jgi:prolipoprotein diacylglyceryltransferase